MIERVADTVHPQPVVSIVGFAVPGLADLGPAGAEALVVVCAEVRDPGNAGTVIRTADAVGRSAVVFADGTVDPTNPKTVRASAGSIFHVPVVDGGPVPEVVRDPRASPGYTHGRHAGPWRRRTTRRSTGAGRWPSCSATRRRG